MLLKILYILSLLFVTTGDVVEPPERIRQEVVAKINEVRSKGCMCGKKYYEPVGPVKWDSKLYNSALSHAKDMYENRFFEHYSSQGLNIGQRLDKHDYYWQQAGENLGEGQLTFNEVMRDWIASPTHCQMLMNPKVQDVAVAKYKKYWVQHFGTKIPPGAKRVE